ncbi:hypothetical protein VTK56DRAFT_7117 [Thermocarpiscus australiensis]
MALNHRRGPWSQAEDAYLMALVQSREPLSWVRISNILGSRTPKQCRERYHQNLKPSLNNDPITPEEGAEIERLVDEIGKRWAEIARRLNNRSDNAVKNWWHGSQNRRKRAERRRATQTQHEERRAERKAMSLFRRPDTTLHSLPPPPPPSARPVPAPLLPSVHDSRYGLETPLPSPSSFSPSTELAPRLDLPPLKMPAEALLSPVSPAALKLPPLSSMIPMSPCDLPTAPNSPVNSGHLQARQPRIEQWEGMETGKVAVSDLLG